MKTEKNSTYKLGSGSWVSGLGSHQQSRVPLFEYAFFLINSLNSIKLILINLVRNSINWRK